MGSIDEFRDFYARYVVGVAGSTDERLIAAFSSVHREDFVGPGPWSIFIGSGYLSTTSDDPRFVYQDLLVGLAPERGINNGEPSLHARCLAAVMPRFGETVVHIGAGTGYYTALLAALVGTMGQVTAFEIAIDLAERAKGNLRGLPNVHVIAGSGAESSLPNADVIYVNAGATHPLESWLDALNLGGRLIFPLTPNEGFGCMLRVTRVSETQYAASVVTQVTFIPCIGARDEQASATLASALQTQSLTPVRSLRRGNDHDETACCVGSGWWLSSREPEVKAT